MEVTRLNGDRLSLRFGPDGSLSSAYLLIEGHSTVVTARLPGLREDLAVEYAHALGFRPNWEPECKEFNELLCPRLRKAGLFISGLFADGDEWIMSCSCLTERERAMARLAFSLRCDRTGRPVEPLVLADEDALGNYIKQWVIDV